MDTNKPNYISIDMTPIDIRKYVTILRLSGALLFLKTVQPIGYEKVEEELVCMIEQLTAELTIDTTEEEEQ